ncbi:MAG: hypothetical protein FWF60_02790 [Oscillospiraceae bacterium]|nr:hypothetical protein [Oscillospiraceae bacterium]
MCDILGVAYTTFSDWYNGNKYPRIDKIEMMANYFGILKSDLVEDKEGRAKKSGKATYPAPILGRVAAGLPIFAEENIEGYTTTTLNGGATYFALRVQGDSMSAAHIPDGCLVIVRQQKQLDNGDIGIVLVEEQDATIKYWKKEGDMVVLSPASYNPEHQAQVYDARHTKIEVLGKVREIQIFTD